MNRRGKITKNEGFVKMYFEEGFPGRGKFVVRQAGITSAYYSRFFGLLCCNPNSMVVWCGGFRFLVRECQFTLCSI